MNSTGASSKPSSSSWLFESCVVPASSSGCPSVAAAGPAYHTWLSTVGPEDHAERHRKQRPVKSSFVFAHSQVQQKLSIPGCWHVSALVGNSTALTTICVTLPSCFLTERTVQDAKLTGNRCPCSFGTEPRTAPSCNTCTKSVASVRDSVRAAPAFRAVFACCRSSVCWTIKSSFWDDMDQILQLLELQLGCDCVEQRKRLSNAAKRQQWRTNGVGTEVGRKQTSTS